MKRLALVVVMTVICSLVMWGNGFAEVFETPKSRIAADILPADMRSGEHFKVRDTVAVYNYLHAYTVDSDFGTFVAIGDGDLRKLLMEIRAIAELKKIADAEAFAKALGSAASAPVRFGVNLVTDPVDTISGIAQGIGQLFADTFSSASARKQSGEDSAAEEALALSRMKREYALNLGVDVYSSNQVFQNELNRVAWGAVVGNFGFSAATTPLGGIGYIVSFSSFGQEMNEYIAQSTPAKIRRDAHEKLTAMGVAEQDIKAFLEAKGYTPRHTVVIVEHLARLGNVSGRASFIQYASIVQNEEEATFMMNIAETLGGYHQKISPIKHLSVTKPLVSARAENGAVIVPFPLDYGVWTEQVSALVHKTVTENRKHEGKPKFELWVTGKMSPLAKQNLDMNGITVYEEIHKRMDFIDYALFAMKKRQLEDQKR